MPKVSAVSAADICLYSRCPRSYWLSRVEEVPPTVTGHNAQEAALTDIIYAILKEEIVKLDEAQGKFEMNLTKRMLSVDDRVSPKPSSLIMDGQRWLNYFWTLERPGIQAEHAGITVETKFNLPLSKRVTITAELPIVDRFYLGFIKCAKYRLGVKHLWLSSYYALTCLVANVPNIYVLIFARGTGELVRRRFVWNSKARNQIKHLADEAVKGMRRGIWRRCDFESPWCNKYGCPQFFECSKRYAEDEVVQT